MELDLTSRLKRSQSIARASASPEKSSTPVREQKSAVVSKEDRLSLSRQAVAYLEEQNRQFQEKLEQRRMENAERVTHTAFDSSGGDEQSLDQLEKSMKTMQKCQKIAARIMRGDKVPPEDEQYLMNNDPDGYKLAIALRKPKRKPKEWESVLDDEDKNSGESVDGASEASSDSGVSSAEGSAGASDGGGDPASSGGEAG